ncbi:MAG: lysophospholipid acyltransferase family protein [Actinomycetota bacterium]
MEPVYSLLVGILRPLLAIGFRWRLLGQSNVPRTGPVIFACNHISFFDPLSQGYFLVRCRRRLRFFAKAELWRNPLLRLVLKGAHQIPVHRGTGETGPVEGALAALSHGDAVVIYPEGTITRTPDLSPMKGKTGVARVALASGAPVVPVAVWGSQWVSPYKRTPGRRLGRLIFVEAGPPMTFKDLQGHDNEDPAVLREITDRIMAELDRLVRGLQKQHPDGAAIPPLKKEAA